VSLTSRRGAAAALLAVFFLAFALRAYPYLSSGVPYHTDTYPQLANARNLVENSPVPLSPGRGFDSYNILWPADTLFYAVSSVLLGAPPFEVMPLLGPLVTSAMVVLFFALLRSFGLDRLTSLIATLLFAVAGGTVMISAGVTKEGFALPLLVLLLLLMNVWLKRGSAPALGLAFAAFGVLLAAHSLASVVGLLLCSYMVLAYVLARRATRSRAAATAGALALFSAGAYLYFYVYAVSALPYDLQPADVVSVFGYEALLTAPVWLAAAFRFDVHRWTGAWMGATALGVSGLFASALAYHPLLDSPVASPYVAALVVPYLAVAFLASLGARAARGAGDQAGPCFAALWALGVLGIAAFSAFGTPGAVGTTLRIMDFVYPGVAVLGALALSALAARGRGAAWLAFVAVGALVVGSAYVVPYSAYWSGPLGGSQRVYSQGEVSALAWTADAPPGTAVYADARYGYLASYYGGNLSLGGGYLFLAGVRNFTSGCVIVDELVSQIGYVGDTYGLPVSMEVVGSLPSRPGLVADFADGAASVYCAS
jgi:hypothetical protein